MRKSREIIIDSSFFRSKETSLGYQCVTKNKGLKDINPIFIGYEKCEPLHKFGPAIRNCYLIHFVSDGNGIFCVDGKTFNVKKGEIFIIKPEEITFYQSSADNPWTYLWVGFDGEYSKRLDSLSSPVYTVSQNLFAELKNLVDCESNVTVELVTSILFRVFAELFADRKPPNNYIAGVERYISTNYMRDITVDGIASVIRLDRRYLSRVFKASTGKSIQQYLIELRMGKAVELILQGYNITQSAEMVGYQDVFNFSKMFKKQYGVSPREYVKSMKEKNV